MRRGRAAVGALGVLFIGAAAAGAYLALRARPQSQTVGPQVDAGAVGNDILDYIRNSGMYGMPGSEPTPTTTAGQTSGATTGSIVDGLEALLNGASPTPTAGATPSYGSLLGAF